MRLIIFRFVAFLGSAAALGAGGPKIGFILKDRSPFWAEVENEIHREAQKDGVDVVVSAPMAIGAAGLQLKLLGVLVEQHCDVIAISPMGKDEFREPIAAARTKGIKIIILDSPFPDGYADAVVGLDQEQISELGAQLFVTLVHDGDAVAVLRSNGVEPLGAREKKMRELLHAACPHALVYSDIYIGVEAGDEEHQANVLLEKHPDVKAVFTPYTAPTLGMMHAIAHQGLAGKLLQVGFGVSLPPEVQDAIDKGALQGWIVQQPRLLAAKGLETALALASGKPVPAMMKIPGLVVTQKNLHDPAVQAVVTQ